MINLIICNQCNNITISVLHGDSAVGAETCRRHVIQIYIYIYIYIYSTVSVHLAVILKVQLLCKNPRNGKLHDGFLSAIWIACSL